MRYPWAVPGRKVVCVDAAEHAPLNPRIDYIGTLDGLTEGVTYTIRSVQIDPFEQVLSFRLVEIIRPLVEDEIEESGYRATRFRPLHTIETDVALFAELLTPAPNAPMLPTNTNLEPTP